MNEPSPPPLSSGLLVDGSERITPTDTVLDFWRWALGDLRLNSTRGLLAQFLVARAVGDARRADDGWGPYDVETPTGLKIEVKASGYLQSWVQTRPSSIRFSGLITRRWDAETNQMDAQASVMADVYVFAVHTCQDPSAYDPINFNYWQFYVVSGEVIRSRNQRSMALSTVKHIAGEPVGWDRLRHAIQAVAAAGPV